jgi:hypothetical protein
MATSKSTTPKVAYIYKESSPPGNGTWHPVAGMASTNIPYTWGAAHEFSAAVTFSDVVKAKAGVNNFQNPSARDAAIPSPTAGIVCFLRQDSSGNTINQIQYYNGSAWTLYSDIQLVAKTANYVVTLADSGKTITMNSSSANTITIPTNATTAFPIGSVITIFQTGTGTTSFVEASGVTINSKNSYKRLYTQYSAGQLVKVDTDIWILAGDLKA